MRAPDAELQLAPRAPASNESGVRAPLGRTIPELTDILGPAEEAARGMLAAEEALRVVKQRFEHTGDPGVRGELATEALDHVERQLALMRERRRQLDSDEAKLWARQNRLEGFLIRTRGSAWWHARRHPAPDDLDRLPGTADSAAG